MPVPILLLSLLLPLSSASPALPTREDPALPGVLDAPPPELVLPVAPAAGEPEEAVAGEPHLLLRNDWVYPGPRRTRVRRGRVTRDEVVLVTGRVEGSGCRGPWGRLAGEGYLCLDRATPTDTLPTALPRVLAFDAPEPAEFWSYVETGTWDQAPDALADALVPWIYGKRWRGWQGVFYDSISDFERGREPSEDQLEGNRKYHFAGVEPSTRGPVLVRRNGQVVPLDGIHLYPLPRFAGRDLGEDPLPPGRIAGWVHGYEGGVLRTEPRADAAVLAELPYHALLELDAAPADVDGRWWRVPDALGDGVDGYVSEEEGVRRWSSAPPPADLPDRGLWVDVDVRQQILTVYDGSSPVYVTLVSTGKRGHSTPLGTFRVFDKMVTVDMMSRKDAPEDDRYHVEEVPWSMHFWPRYALHGAYWHWGFGNRASHGCVNLSPRDARWIFDRLDPELPPGWHSVFEDAGHPGAVLRIRDGQALGRDRRFPPGEHWDVKAAR